MQMTIKPNSFAPHAAVAPVGKAMSDRIKIARSLCIFFMTFVHVPQGIAENVYDRDAGLFDIVYFVLTRLMGLSSVSLLSVVSGYFIVSSLLKAGAGPLTVSKLKTLVVPLVAWNLLMLVLLAAYGVLSGNWKDMPEFSPLGMANALLAVTEWPLVVPLWFLRDLFVCCLFAPLLYPALRRFPIATMLALVAFTLLGENLYILQRPQLMLFFGLGMWLRISAADEQGIDHSDRTHIAVGNERHAAADARHAAARHHGGGLLEADRIHTALLAIRPVHTAGTIRLLPVLQPRDPVRFRRHHLPACLRRLRVGSLPDHIFHAALPCRDRCDCRAERH
jgi:hypothetical protein